MYSDFYNTNPIQSSQVSMPDTTWIAISAVLALVGGIVAYFMFVADKKGRYTGFVAWLHDFLNFKTFFINMVLKILYIVSTLFITLSSFSFISVSVATFFLWLILGNIINRVVYEFVLMFLTLVNNTTEINNKLPEGKKEIAKPSIKPKKAVRPIVVEEEDEIDEVGE
ncbi:MAG TPA: hypothetical protein DCY94_04275 [Firmicutes bacterium]|nr:hypothetical protein [Bacillota bacterium]